MKRVRWMGAGLAVGFGGALWAQRKAKAIAARYTPASVAGRGVNRALDFPGEVRAALREGRAAMREREAELRGDATVTPIRRGKQSTGRP